jgi:uncharacterized membrane protein YeaQ/YmgE (transglycosylase-associated protein family)
VTGGINNRHRPSGDVQIGAPADRLSTPSRAGRRAVAGQAPISVGAEQNSEHKGETTMLHLIGALIIGGIAGWLAGLIMKGGGFGVLVDIIVGIVGGFIGGWLAQALHIQVGNGLISSLIVAFVGAVILLFVIRLIKRVV